MIFIIINIIIIIICINHNMMCRFYVIF